jgi:Putative peptidoglycan binding domain
MTGIVMHDTIFNHLFPPGAQAYAAYVDGHIGDQPNYSWIVANFPGAFHLSITVLGNDADALDIESGAVSVSSAARWYQGRKAAGVARPVFYASASLMNSSLIPAIKAAGIPRSGYRLWSAHYGDGRHICGPGSCGLMSIPADGTQWTDHEDRLSVDESLLIPSFFSGITPPDPVKYLSPAEMSAIVNALPVLSLPPAGKPFMSDKDFPHWYVRRLQLILSGVWSLYKGSIDGIYGSATAAAVKALQGQLGLTPDGICGPVTWSRVIAG